MTKTLTKVSFAGAIQRPVLKFKGISGTQALSGTSAGIRGITDHSPSSEGLEKKQNQQPVVSNEIRVDEPHEIAGQLTDSQLAAFVEGLSSLVPQSSAPADLPAPERGIEADEDLRRKIDEYL